MAAVLDLPALAQAHKAVAGAALPVAGGAEGGNISQLHQPFYHFIQGAVVADIELLGVVGALLLGVAAHAGAAAAGHLGNAQMQRPLPDGLVFPGGHNHAGVGHGHPDAGADFQEGVVVNAVVELVGVDIVGVLHPGHADGVGPHPVDSLQVLGVHQQPGELIAVQLQAEQHAQAHVVNAALHGPVHGLGVVAVVALGAGGVQVLVALLVVGLLEQDVGADARLLQLAVVLHGGGGDVHVHPADGAVFVLDGVDGVDAVQHILNGAVDGVLAGLDGQALVAHVLQGDDLFLHFLLGQLFPGDVLVLLVVGTVQTAVDAVVRQVQRREDDNAVAVEILFDLLGQGVQLLDLLGDVAGQQHRGLPVRQALALPGLVQNLVDELHVVFVLIGIGQGVQDFLVVDKFLGFQRLGIVHEKSSFLLGQKHFPISCNSERGGKLPLAGIGST